ncbi:alpha/beta hydrolase [Paralimibaculum aggregatum]|uniref:Alpha/beta hydrolase n=1 Tax=Paralimibaculum aggregatum TaxID=3036245 RepID=A0ABQ6LMM0_9RHOB|nr:alpha/beta hydrolase [Limibaculum sp. NKW23]GMG84222.1 alpha/beta hydrolase [Limibaculum sp. NKW23]
MPQSPAITDPEIAAFVAEADGFPPEPPGDIAAQRRAYDAMAAHFRVPRPAGVSVTDASLPGPAGPIPVRSYAPGAPGRVRIVYCHGGAYSLGGLESHDDVCAEIAAATGCVLTAVDYRLAPEHRHPAAFEDALAATEAALAEGPAVVAGDSAGGGLAAAVALALRGRAELRGQALIYPTLGGEALGLASYADCATAPLLTTADILALQAARAGGPPPLDDPSFAPLLAVDMDGAAPCYATAAEVDPLRDDAPALAERLRVAGVPVTLRIEAGLPHMWLRARHRSAAAKAAFAALCAGIAALARD